FFFSSRRRHTRSKRDWSSDVCSSDLALQVDALDARLLRCGSIGGDDHLRISVHSGINRQNLLWHFEAKGGKEAVPRLPTDELLRSEERRVGKECGSWGWREQREARKR